MRAISNVICFSVTHAQNTRSSSVFLLLYLNHTAKDGSKVTWKHVCCEYKCQVPNNFVLKKQWFDL